MLQKCTVCKKYKKLKIFTTFEYLTLNKTLTKICNKCFVAIEKERKNKLLKLMKDSGKILLQERKIKIK